MKLERALEEYERRKKRAEKEAERLKERYNRRLRKKIGEILKKIDDLERKEVPKKIDESIKRIVTAERRNYVNALRKALSNITTMEELGKRLPDLAKLHVGHGRYLLVIFEKDVYAINRLLKELNEDYVSYYNELMKTGIGSLEIEGILEEEEETRKEVLRTEEEIRELEERLKSLREGLEEFYREMGLDELEEEIKRASSRLKSGEMEVRSKASKLQKPVKRMRLHEPLADELVRDSSVVLRKPKEVTELLRRIESRLEGKYKKTARWLIDNLEDKARILERERAELMELEERKRSILSQAEARKREIREIEKLIRDREAELKKLRNKLEHLEKELDDAIARLEEILGEKIER